MHLADSPIQTYSAFRYIFFYQHRCSLGIKPVTFVLLTQCSTRAIGTHNFIFAFFIYLIKFNKKAFIYVDQTAESVYQEDTYSPRLRCQRMVALKKRKKSILQTGLWFTYTVTDKDDVITILYVMLSVKTQLKSFYSDSLFSS